MPAPRDITALILAGGFGTRVKDLLGDLPKPMAPVNGKPFVEWIVRWLKAQARNSNVNIPRVFRVAPLDFIPTAQIILPSKITS